MASLSLNLALVRWRRFAIVAALLVAALAFQALRVPFVRDFLGFGVMQLASSGGCSEVATSNFFPTMRRIEVVGNNTNVAASCESALMPVQGNYAELEIALKNTAVSSDLLNIAVFDQDGRKLKDISASQFYHARKWQRAAFQFDPALTKAIKFVITNNSADWLSVRHRVNFYHAKLGTQAFGAFAQQKEVETVVICILALMLGVFALKWASELSRRLSLQLVCFFVIATLVHFRIGLFFNIDDWNILWGVVMHEGISRYFVSHLEHFIPLFKFILRLEYYIFQGHYEAYILLAILIHSFNALLLQQLVTKMLQHLDVPESSRPLISIGLSLLYLVSGLHTEVITWMICQSSLLAVSAALGAALCSIRYIETKRLRYVFGSAIASLAAPLCFGGGLLLGPFVVGVVLPTIVFCSPATEFKENLRRYFIISSVIAIALFSDLGAYALFLTSEKVSHVGVTQIFSEEFRRFILLGVAVGVFARGSSFVPHFSVQQWKQSWPYYSDSDLEMMLIGYGIGCCCVIVLLLCAWFSSPRKRTMLFLCGSSIAFIVLSYVVVAVGRVHEYGVWHALALRYTSFPLLALYCAMLPLAVWITKYRANVSLQKYRNAIAFLGLVFLFAGQLNISLSYRHYQIAGVQYRLYLSEFKHWERQLAAKSGQDCSLSVNGEGTDLLGHFPLLQAGDAANLYAAQPDFDPYQMLILANNKTPCG